MNDLAPISITRTRDSLLQVFGKLDSESFLREYWQVKPFHDQVRQDGWVDLLSIETLQQLASTHNALASRIRLFREGQRYDELFAPGSFHSYIDRGVTMVFPRLEKWHEPLHQVTQQLSLLFTARVTANAYLSPRGNRGLALHYDPHEVFVLQLDGEKIWTLAGQGYINPLDEDLKPANLLSALTSPKEQLTTIPGTLLYIPRGWIHQAVAGEHTSLHVTLGVRGIPWKDLLLQIVGNAPRSAELRAYVPHSTLIEADPLAELRRHIRSLFDGHRNSLISNNLLTWIEQTIQLDEPVAVSE